MKILVIDYLSYEGHRNFNRIHLQTLIEQGHQLCLVGKDGQFEEYVHQARVKIIEFPKSFVGFAEDSRLRDIYNLIWTRLEISVEEFDIILFPTYDILSLFVYRSKKTTVIINHNTVGLLDDSLYGRIRYFLTRTLPGQYIHICLNIDMEKHLKELLPNRQVTYIPHGICSPSKILTKPSYIKEHERFLICPINRNYDISVVEELLSSEVLHNFLERENIKLFIKRQLSYRGICSNIIKIDNELSQPEYDYMLQNAMAVILPYGKRFKYRCSGIFFECVSRNTPILATDLEAMRIYDGLVNIGYFNNAVEMIQQLDICVLRKQVFYNKEMFNPYNHWKKLLDAIVKKTSIIMTL